MVQQPPGPPPGGMQPPPPPGQPPQAPAGPPKLQIDTSKLPIADIIVAAGALLAWIMALLPWYRLGGYREFGVTFPGVSWRGGFQWLPWVIFFLLMIYAVFVIVNKYTNLVDLSLPNGLIYLAAGGVGLLCILLGFLVRPYGWDVASMNWAVWIIAIILSCGPLVGGYMKLQES